MCALELEVGEGVVERFFVETDDVRLASLVIAVAVPAIGLGGLWIAPVIALRSLAVRRHVLVAVEAFRRLRLAGERNMAAIAVLLVLRVPLDQLARHDELLKHALRFDARGEASKSEQRQSRAEKRAEANAGHAGSQ